MKKENNVIIVNEKDEQVAVTSKLNAHKNGLLHRAFSVFIFRNNNAIEFLLQKRNENKYHSGGLWSNACCSHPKPNEEIVNAAKRRLREEMGIQATLKRAGSFIYKIEFDNGLTEYEFDHVLIGKYKNSPIEINSDEVSEYCWITQQTLARELKENPNKFSYWLPQAFNIATQYLKEGSKNL